MLSAHAPSCASRRRDPPFGLRPPGFLSFEVRASFRRGLILSPWRPEASVHWEWWRCRPSCRAGSTFRRCVFHTPPPPPLCPSHSPPPCFVLQSRASDAERTCTELRGQLEVETVCGTARHVDRCSVHVALLLNIAVPRCRPSCKAGSTFSRCVFHTVLNVCCVGVSVRTLRCCSCVRPMPSSLAPSCSALAPSCSARSKSRRHPPPPPPSHAPSLSLNFAPARKPLTPVIRLGPASPPLRATHPLLLHPSFCSRARAMPSERAPSCKASSKSKQCVHC